MESAKIAIIEDDKTLLDLMEKYISRTFNNIKTYNSPIKFFDDYETFSPEIIITDIRMPDMSGLELVSRIREVNKEIPIIITSAFSDKEYFLKAIENKIDFYMTKPINVDLLMEKLNEFQKQIELKKEDEKYKKYLENRVKEEVHKRLQKEKVLVEQSRLAAMGEMMDAVAHQWKQPLTIMGMNVDMLEEDFRTNNLDEKVMSEFTSEFKFQMLHMLNTLEQFRNFFRPNKKIETFTISDIIDFALLLVKDEFKKNQIIFEKNIIDNYELTGNSNDFVHMILNIINNAKDAFNEREIKNRTIKFEAKKDNKYLFLTISDNAGGIPEEVLPKIFKPNVTTKEVGKGTGIGLYLSRQVALLKFHGMLHAKNIDDGVMFTFKRRIYSNES